MSPSINAPPTWTGFSMFEKSCTALQCRPNLYRTVCKMPLTILQTQSALQSFTAEFCAILQPLLHGYVHANPLYNSAYAKQDVNFGGLLFVAIHNKSSIDASPVVFIHCAQLPAPLQCIFCIFP